MFINKLFKKNENRLFLTYLSIAAYFYLLFYLGSIFIKRKGDIIFDIFFYSSQNLINLKYKSYLKGKKNGGTRGGKELCFLSSTDFNTIIEKYNLKSENFEPRDLRLCSCMFNILPNEINETKILVIGSKKKVGRDFVNLLKANGIKYGRVKNRNHINIGNFSMQIIIKALNFDTIVDLSNDEITNYWLSKNFSHKRLIRVKSVSLNRPDYRLLNEKFKEKISHYCPNIEKMKEFRTKHSFDITRERKEEIKNILEMCENKDNNIDGIHNTVEFLDLENYSSVIKECENYNGTTILANRIYQPKFFPHKMYNRSLGDLNYYIFDEYFLSNSANSDSPNINNPNINNSILYTPSEAVAKEIFNIILTKHHENSFLFKTKFFSKTTEGQRIINQKIIDLRNIKENSLTTKEILHNINNDNTFKRDLISYYTLLREEAENNIYVSHVTTVSADSYIIKRYQSVVLSCEKALESFYGFASVEFICVTNADDKEQLKKNFDWYLSPNEYKYMKKHHNFIMIPSQLIEKIKNDFRIFHFPEFFLRNIGLRRAKGRYMISGSCDVFMPPLFFMNCVKHLFAKSFTIRTRRNDIPENDLVNLNFNDHYIKYVKNYKIKSYLVNIEFNIECDMPPNPINRECGDFQGFHREFWYKLNGYMNLRYNFNVDSFLSYKLLSMFSPIVIKIQFGEYHYAHRHVSSSTPQLSNMVYCGEANIKKGIITESLNGNKDWGYPNTDFLIV